MKFNAKQRAKHKDKPTSIPTCNTKATLIMTRDQEACTATVSAPQLYTDCLVVNNW